MIRFIFSCFFLISIHSSVAQARIEYAFKYRVNQCAACHFNPTGGSFRNLYGKQFGEKSKALSPFAKQDYVAADVRAIYYNPENANKNKGGLGVMSSVVGASIPLNPDDAGDLDIRLVVNHNLGGFPGGLGGPRDSYVRWHMKDSSIAPDYFLFGRFNAPFGVMTDEHRTYTRIQTATTWNHLEMGALAAFDPVQSLHLDWALVNGEKTSGIQFSTGAASLWGTILNIRFMPARMPFLLGLSGQYHRHDIGDESPWAASAYGALSFDRLTDGIFSASVFFEAVTAKYWNSGITNFVSDPAYLTSVSKDQSLGYLTYFVWDFLDNFSLIYKYDYLALDQKYPADSFDRHGIGFRYLAAHNMNVQFRYESADSGHPTEENKTGTGSLDAFWLVFGLYL